jgi:hypothetical protein
MSNQHQHEQKIHANHDDTVETKDFNFHFKKDKLGNKRASVELKLPIPSVQGIISILEKGGKGLELLQEAVYDVIRGQVAVIVSEKEDISQANFPVANISWESIANMPKSDRRSSSIAEETWEAFAKDYIETMPAVTGKSVEAVTNATVVFLKKFSIVKTNKEVIRKLKEQLALYVEHTKQGDNFADIIELLNNKAESYLGANDVELLVANL